MWCVAPMCAPSRCGSKGSRTVAPNARIAVAEMTETDINAERIWVVALTKRRVLAARNIDEVAVELKWMDTELERLRRLEQTNGEVAR